MFPGWIEDFQPPRTYDYVLCTEILEHVPDPVAVLRTARRALAPAGLAYITSPSTHWGNNTHVRGVAPDDLRAWLADAGLAPDSIFVENERTFALASRSS
jgi:2-polyprenyl-3-methyl-5-hydroxy-6-metoxy-1,4-benzoquinol methylase